MNVLIACEFSATVRDAFIRRGHDAWSCDLLPTEGRQANHLQGDIRWALDGMLHRFPNAVDCRTGNAPIIRKWDLMIGHPPCTYLTNSGVRWLYIDGKRNENRWRLMEEAAKFYLELWNADIPKIALENPIMHGYAKRLIGGGHTQIIQPWQFGHGECKATGFRLKNLPMLFPTKMVAGREQRVAFASPGPDRWKERSRTLIGIADAMADQWGALDPFYRVKELQMEGLAQIRAHF